MGRGLCPDLAVPDINHQALDVGPRNIAQLHPTHARFDVPIDANSIYAEGRRLLHRRSLGHVELAQIGHGHLAPPLHLVGLGIPALCGLGDGQASSFSRFFRRDDPMGSQRHEPVSAAVRPEPGEVGPPALRRHPHAKAFEVAVPHDITAVPGLQSLDYPLREPLGHHMATRHVSSVPPQRG
ncbi:hypothetical protein D3C72_1458890 [compost metagenome]